MKNGRKQASILIKAPIACICIAHLESGNYKSLSFSLFEYMNEGDMLVDFHGYIEAICSEAWRNDT